MIWHHDRRETINILKAILVFQTDFTYKEAAVSAMYGVVKSVDRDLEIITGTHEIPNYDIWSGSFRLYQPMQFWPKGTIFVSVIDPGVGTSRRACIAQTKNGYTIVTPDNGSLTHVAKHFGIERVVEIDIDRHRLKGQGTEGISVFHGRDVFAYCAAQLASGQVAFEDFGTEYPVDEIVTFDLIEPVQAKDRLTGMGEIIDPNFGNYWTNIPFAWLKDQDGKSVWVIVRSASGEVVFDEPIQIHKTFGEVSLGELTIYQNEFANLSLAINQGSFISKYDLPYGVGVSVEVVLSEEE